MIASPLRCALTCLGLACLVTCLTSAKASADVPVADSRDKVYEHIEVLLLGELYDGETWLLEPANELEAYVVPAGRTLVLTDVNVGYLEGRSLSVRRDDVTAAICGTGGWPGVSNGVDLQSFVSGPRFPAGSTVTIGSGVGNAVLDFVALRGYLTRE